MIVQGEAFRSVPELAKVMEQLDDEKFAKLMAFLRNPVSRRFRTNNHGERMNRMFRLLAKVGYQRRRRKTLVRFVVLTLDAIRSAWTPAKVKTAQSPTPVRSGEKPSQAAQESRQVA